jgi:hypothetical protein
MVVVVVLLLLLLRGGRHTASTGLFMLTASSLLLVPNEGTSTSPGRSAPSPLLFLLRRAMLPPVLGGVAPWRGGKGSVMAALRRTLGVFVFVVSYVGRVVS